MVEKNLLVDGLEINYEGLFTVDGLFKKIDQLTGSKGYARVEKERSEKVTEKGKEIFFELRPAKVPHPYHMLFIYMYITIKDVEDIEIIIDGVKKIVQKGKVNIEVNGWEWTDFFGRWEQNPWYTVLSNVVDKFIYRFTDRYGNMVVGDTHYVYDNLKAYLDLHRYISETKTP